jgi:hypothetical protein
MPKDTVDGYFELSSQYLSVLTDEPERSLSQKCQCFGHDLNKVTSEYHSKLYTAPMITKSLGFARNLTFVFRRGTAR